MFPLTSKIKLIAGAVSASLLLVAFLVIKDAFDDRAELNTMVNAILIETRLASDNPKLKKSDIANQIKIMGEDRKQLGIEIAVQNEAIDALEEKRKQALDYADKQAELREEVIGKSKELAKQLRTKALSPVENSNLEAELRKIQDMAWEIGL